jgi:pyrroloquinoline quinone biosynthesis protein B
MLIRFLGSAAGGGFPQWNCACTNCARLRAGTLLSKSRTQAQLAISANGHEWFLLGASPDLRMQLEATPPLLPSNQSAANHRSSPIAGVVFLSAELDHSVGLLTLRERHPLRIYATASVRKLVAEENSFFRMMEREPGQSQWNDLRLGERIELRNASGEGSGIGCMALSVGHKFPFFAGPGGRTDERTDLASEEAVLGLLLDDSAGRKMFYAPGLGEVTSNLMEIFRRCDLLLLDGSFWSDNELVNAAGKGQTAREMGHLPLSGPDGLLHVLAQVNGPRKILIHINNTNPILDEASEEFREVNAAGWEVAEDGWAIEI